MNPNHQFDLRRILLYVAAVTAVVCAVITLFFRSSVFTGLFSTLISILSPFLYGAVIAYILRPVCVFLEERIRKIGKNKTRTGLDRMISVTLSVIIMFAVIVLLLVAVLPEMINSISALVQQIEPTIERFQEWLGKLDQSDLSHEVVANIENAVKSASDWMENFLSTDLLPTLQSVLPGVTSGFMGFLDFLKNFGLGCIVAFYLLADWEHFVARAKLLGYGLLPERAADWLKRELFVTNGMFSGFISGKLLDSLLMGLITFVFMSITRMPYAVLISVLMGVTNIIPFFGPYIGLVPSVLMLLTVSPVTCLIFIVFMIILQQFDGNVMSPRILGGKLGISGFWILFAILFFGALWGFAGMLVGVPLFAVLYDLLRKFIFARLRGRNHNEMLEEYEKQFGGK